MKQFSSVKKAKITNESWFKTRWRPSMAWLYMALIAYDFMLMPILWPAVAFLLKITPIVAWIPLTLQGGGFIHVTFGAILGLYTWGRTAEIKAGATTADEEEDPDDIPVTTVTATATTTTKP